MEVLLTLQSVATPGLDRAMQLITELGSQSAYVVLLIVTFLGIDARAGRTIGLAVMVSFYLNQLLKPMFDTLRPFEVDPALVRSEQAEAGALGAGFPSGHAQSSATFWGLAAVYGRRRWFAVLAAVLIVLIALSRIYLGVHFPVDVVGGLALGLAVVGLVVALERSRFEPPGWALLLLGLALPLTLHLLLPTPESNLILATFAAFATGPLVVRHRTDGAWWRRALVTLVGLMIAFGYLLGSSVTLSDAVKDHPLWGFVRYLLLGYLITVAVPLLARLLRLVPPASAASTPRPAGRSA